MLSSRSAIGACPVAGADVRVGRAASLRAAPQRMCGPLRASHTDTACQQRIESADHSLARRPVLLGALALLGLGQPRSASAVGVAEVALAPAPAPLQAPSSSTTRYEDTIDKFGLDIPAGWVQAEGSIPNEGGFAGVTGARRTVAFFPADRPPRDVSVSVTITNVSFEFTKLGSFGNVAAFANNLINSLDRSFLLRRPAWQKNPDEPIQIASLVDYNEKNEQYIIEYTVQKLPEPKRHLLSKLALGSNGVYNRLYTLTAQCNEEELPQYRAAFDVAVDSFIANVKPLI